MQIVHNQTYENSTFDEVKEGEIFLANGDVFMKIPLCANFNTEEEIAAICMKDGQGCSFWGDDKVIVPKNVQLIIN